MHESQLQFASIFTVFMMCGFDSNQQWRNNIHSSAWVSAAVRCYHWTCWLGVICYKVDSSVLGKVTWPTTIIWW